MASKTKQIAETRAALLTLFNNYLFVARGIKDLETEGDYDDLEDGIDALLEQCVFNKEN